MACNIPHIIIENDEDKTGALKDLKLSSKKVSILAIHHEGALIANPPPDTMLDEEDVMVLLGPSEELREIA